MNITRNGYLSGLMGVFSSAAFLSYSWSIIVFFWDLPSFLLQWGINDIVGYLAYQFMFTFAGSMVVTIFVAIIGLVFPERYLRYNIRTSGTALVAAFAVNSIIFKERYGLIYALAGAFSIDNFTASQITMSVWTISLIILPIGLVIVSKFKPAEHLINNYIENISILVIFYVVLSLLGILLVIFRNII